MRVGSVNKLWKQFGSSIDRNVFCFMCKLWNGWFLTCLAPTSLMITIGYINIDKH